MRGPDHTIISTMHLIHLHEGADLKVLRGANKAGVVAVAVITMGGKAPAAGFLLADQPVCRS